MTASRSIRAQHALGVGEQLLGRLGERQQAQVVVAPREHVRVVLDRGGEDLRARRQRVGEDVDRLGGVADEDDAAVMRRRRSARRCARAFSYASVEIRDFAPVPRWTLLYHGTNASTASHTAVITGVLAA